MASNISNSPPSPSSGHVLFQAKSHEFDSEKYLYYRPRYTESLYEHIFSYHSLHGGQWEVAHDVGCGVGIVATKLGSRFANVVCSDPSAEYLAQARARLLADTTNAILGEKEGKANNNKYSFVQAKAEGMADWPIWEKTVYRGSIDMVTIAEAIHWMDHQRVINEAAEILRPGGTLAIIFYSGAAVYPDCEQGNQVLSRIYNKFIAKLIKAEPGIKKSLNVGFSLLDVVAVDNTDLVDVKRLKWYTDTGLLTKPYLDGCDGTSTIGVKEEVVHVADGDDLWCANTDAQWFRGYLDTIYPGILLDDEDLGLYNDLDKALKGKKAKMVWPAVLILASKK